MRKRTSNLCIISSVKSVMCFLWVRANEYRVVPAFYLIIVHDNKQNVITDVSFSMGK